MHEPLRDSIEANWEYLIPICFTCKAKSLKLEAIKLTLEVFWDSNEANKLNRILIWLSGDANKGECGV
ncbi:hypothetical protein D0X99_13915 [Algoriphagus lacus]|uniref:Uncharacterized protein n=1 Tax=Algoriphagus lacus TaxID=2056311 RepID=A0A418PQN8_9BACT|nr:hypothetical protein D0X99_13915 [Algoriphagus lacus]